MTDRWALRFTVFALGCLLSTPFLVPSFTVSAEAGAREARLSRAEMEQFLRSAKILNRRGLSVGITGSERATLSDGRLTHDAHVQTVDIRKSHFQSAAGVQLNFRDSYKYNIAAYRLDRLLHLDMIPVSVERKVAGKTASVTWWVDDVQMMERKRFLKRIEPPDRSSWNDQMYQARVFNELIYNTDPNLGNYLITHDWTLWMVDFTRAFRTHKNLKGRSNLKRIDRRFYDGLRGLNEPALMEENGHLLTKTEVRALLARRDRILEFFDVQIAEKGERAVVCDLAGH